MVRLRYMYQEWKKCPTKERTAVFYREGPSWEVEFIWHKRWVALS